MERRREGVRRRAGFTLAEVLVTLGIVAVLLALAVPSVAVVRKNLKMAELNATAREIFLAAQNNLTGLAAGGGAVELSAKTGAADPDAVVCLMSGEAVMDSLLPLGAVDPTVAGNHYMVVYYPATLTVKEIYYAERALPAEGETLRSEYGGAAKADERRKDEIGFYDGGNAASSPAKSLPTPVVTIENGEELRAVVTVSGVPAELWEKAVLTISVSDGENTVVLRDKGLTEENTTEVAILDRLWGGNHFREVCGALTPGADVTVVAEVSCVGSGKGAWLSSRDSKTTNSLFASRDKDGTVRIACGRHLQNLDTYTSGMEASDPFTAVQTAAIDWSRSGASDFYAIQNEWLTGYDGQNNEIRNLRVRAAGSNEKAKGVGLFGTTSPWDSTALTNIRIINGNVEGRSNLPCGSLIGMVDVGGASVVNCLVYWDGTGTGKSCRVSGGGNTGGLIGSSKTVGSISISISDCGVGLPVTRGVRSAALGGLVGYAENVVIRNSYAATDQLSGTAEQIGGFIGHGKGVTVSNCYAVGNISAARIEEKDTYFINGFLTGSGNVTDSYCAMTYLTEAGEPRELKINYGFMYKPGVGCAYLKPNASVTIGNSGEQASELTYEELKSWGANKAPWTVLSEPDSHSYRTLDEGEPKYYPFPGLRTENGSPLPHYGSWPKEPEEKTAAAFVYYEVYTDGGIGFEGLTLDGKPLDETGLDQWKLRDGKDVMVARDGYAIVSAEKLEKDPVVTLSYVKKKDVLGDYKLTLIPIAQDGNLSVEGAFFYPLTYDHVQAPSSIKDLFYQELTYTVTTSQDQMEGKLWFNPCFAKSVSATGGTNPADTVAVRSARQLAALGEYSAGWSYNYAQELNIDENQYDRTYAVTLLHSAIGSQTVPFSGSYNGNGNRISGVQLGEKDYQDDWSDRWESYNWFWKLVLQHLFGVEKPGNASEWGLFGYNTGTLEGIVFLGDGEDQTVSGENCKVGGLCGENRGTIQKCAVAGFQVKANDSSSAGGLVGVNAGTIENSYADNSSIEGHDVGGLVGEQVFGGRVSNSYALGELEPEGGSWGGGNSAYAGGLVGRLTGGTVMNSYSACSAEKANYTEYFPTAENSTDCYYLSDVWEHDWDKEEQEARSYADLAKLSIDGFSSERLDADHSHPYDDDLAGAAYPFPVPNGQTDHYGDWPEAEEPSGGAMIGLAVMTQKSTDINTGKTIAHYKAYGVSLLSDGTYSKVNYDEPVFEFDYKTNDVKDVLFFYDPTQTSISNWGYWDSSQWGVNPISGDDIHVVDNYHLVYWTGQFQTEVSFYQANTDGSFPDNNHPTFKINLTEIKNRNPQ